MNSLEVKDSVLDPDSTDHRIRYQGPVVADRTLYRVFIYLDGPALPFVESVTYTLHETFPDRIRTVRRTPRNPSCKLEIRTWGTFEVIAEIQEKRGTTFRLIHPLTFDREIKEAIERNEVQRFQAVA
jgi:transcription initiation factor IIF auxiliary subunit